MGSGMSTSTAIKGRACEGYIRDYAGLRTHPECDIVLDPNFGFLEVWCTGRWLSFVFDQMFSLLLLLSFLVPGFVFFSLCFVFWAIV